MKIRRNKQECCDNRHDRRSPDDDRILTLKSLKVDNLIIRKVIIQESKETVHFNWKFGRPIQK